MLQMYGHNKVDYIADILCGTKIGFNITTDVNHFIMLYATSNPAEGRYKLSYSTIGNDYKGNLD